MYGVDWNDLECIHTVDEAIEYINKIGFLPLFKNEIPGFSLEERTVPEHWWCDDPEKDPWMWRAVIARRRDIVYGKFFDRKAGFISKKWLPVFVNDRRNGYDFDALYEDGKAPYKHKKIMDNFMEDKADAEIYSNELKILSGFGKSTKHSGTAGRHSKTVGKHQGRNDSAQTGMAVETGLKGFDGAITNLMMQMYLCNCDFRKRKNKKGVEYGWDVAIYSSMEHVHETYPVATEKQIKKVLL